jgi:hypothetical protein
MTDAIAATHAELRATERELSATRAERQRAQEACEQMGKRIAELESKIQQCFSIVWGADSIDEARQRVAALLGEKQQ